MASPLPHVGGPVVAICAPTVLIGGLPAARLGDLALCVGGGADMIVEGSTGVFIEGMPAARMGDMTAHGGVLALGDFTVLIGDTVPTELEEASKLGLALSELCGGPGGAGGENE